MAVSNPTDQTADAFASVNDASPGPTTVTDACLPTPATGTGDNVTLSVTYNLTNVGTTGVLHTSRLEYSTNGGSGWTTAATRAISGTTSGTWGSGNLGTLDLSQIQVRGYAYAEQTITPNTGSARAQISAWSITYDPQSRERMIST